MSDINKQARDKLKSAAAKAADNFDPNMFVETRDVLGLLDELEAKDKRIAELSHHLHSAHGFIEHTEAFGHAASNGILCCGDAQWNIDASKLVLAAAGKGEAS